jgi:NRPS condensation-like uncharacterized protein
VTFLRSFKSDDYSEIIATFHHAITDGLSCLRFIHELLSYCQQIADGEQIPEVSTMQLLPPLENLLDNSLTRHNIEDFQAKTEQEIPTPKLIIEDEAPASQRCTRLVPRSLSKEMTFMLMNRCKQEETTVHSALCAAMLFATAKFASTDTPINLSCGSSVNVRKFCEPKVNNEYIGDFALAITENHTLEKTINFWDLARECKLKISNSIGRGFPIQNKLRNIDKNVIIKISDHQMGRNETLHISNLGKVIFLSQYGRFKIQSLYFAPGVHLIGACFWLGVVTFHEQLYCTFVHVVPVVSAKTAEFLAASVISTTEKACLSESLTL